MKVVDSGVTPVCCGQEMKMLKPMDTEAPGTEKHLPYIKSCCGKNISVKIGSELHPMEDEHHIVFIAVETDDGCQIRLIDEKQPPIAEFNCSKDQARAVYAYCNVHGLWKTNLRC